MNKNRYRLKKELAGFHKGDLFYLAHSKEKQADYIKYFHDNAGLSKWFSMKVDDIENFDDWFEKIKSRKVLMNISENGTSKEITIETFFSNEEIAEKINKDILWID